MRQHHALGHAAGAGGVDQAGERRRAGMAGRLQRDVVGRRRCRRTTSRHSAARRRAAGPASGGSTAITPHHRRHQRSSRRQQALPRERGGRDDRDARAPLLRRMWRVVVDRVGGVGRHRHARASPSARVSAIDIPAGSPTRSPRGRRARRPAARRPRAGTPPCGARLAPGDAAATRRRELAQQERLVGPARGQVEQHRGQVRPGRGSPSRAPDVPPASSAAVATGVAAWRQFAPYAYMPRTAD